LVLGVLLHAVVHPADIQDRDGGILVMATLLVNICVSCVSRGQTDSRTSIEQ
jgi:hypothetical protein